MPRLSATDCDTLLRLLEGESGATADSGTSTVDLRNRIEQALAAEGSLAPESRPTSSTPAPDRSRTCTLHVCISCRSPGTAREPREQREGFLLYRELRNAFAASDVGSRVEVRPAECLSVCPRPCGIALSSAGAWTYLFGDMKPGEHAREIMNGAALYAETFDGYMARDYRPKALRASILGRVPPCPKGRPCT